MAIDATGWRVVVTGGANGIGRRTVERIVEAGGRVVAFDADDDALAALAEPICRRSRRPSSMSATRRAVAAAIDGAVASLGGLDRRGQLGRRLPVRVAARHHRGSVGPDARHQPEGHVPRCARPPSRTSARRVAGGSSTCPRRGRPRRGSLGRLHRLEMGRHRPDQGDRRRIRPRRHRRERGGAGDHPGDADGPAARSTRRSRWAGERTPRRRSRTRPGTTRCAGWAPPTTSPGRSASCCPRTQPGCPARSSASTAAITAAVAGGIECGVGIVLPIASQDLPKDRPAYAFVRDVALAAEGAGLDSVWVFDHLLFRFDGETSGIHGVLDRPCRHRRGDRAGSSSARSSCAPGSATRPCWRRWPGRSMTSAAAA